MSTRRRPGLGSAANLAQDVAETVGPLNDIVARVTGVTLAKLRTIGTLPSTAVLADVITAHNALVKAHNALLSRIQED